MCEMPTTSTMNARRAKKPHDCVECSRRIEPGEIYEHVWGIWEGTAETFHTCAECWEVRQDLREDMPSGHVYDEETSCALAFGNLREALADEDREVSYAIRRGSA